MTFGRKSLSGITAYAPDAGAAQFDLSDNTNQFGVPPNALRVVQASDASRLTKYPRGYSEALKVAIGDYLGGMPANQIATGCGSDDVLDCALRAFGEPGDRVAMIEPTFSMVSVFARLNGLEPVGVPLSEGQDVDVERILSADAPIIYLCSPNNPTGGVLSRAAIETIVERAPGVVIIDEAYAEFSGVMSIDLLGRTDRLLVTRTFSKAFGLAGLRIGYGVGSPRLISEIEKSRGPFKVTSVAEEAAVAALTSDIDWVRSMATTAVEVRESFAAEIRAMGLAPLRSDANFLLIPVSDARGLAQDLRRRGISVRPFSALPTIGDAIRITIAQRAVMTQVADALREVMS